MKEFEYKKGEMVSHKHWRIVGKVMQCYRENDYAGTEFHRYDVEFSDPLGGRTWNAPDSTYTEFELTRREP